METRECVWPILEVEQQNAWIVAVWIIIIIIISILEPCFPLPRVGLFDKSFSKASSPLRTVLRVSRIHT